jgi:thiamine-phosphate pyrophosphorylase
MAKSQSAAVKRPAPRLYLVTPVVEDAAAFTGKLDAALAAGDVAAVLLRLQPSDERTLINCTKSLAAVVQKSGVALVLDGHAEIVSRAGADGAHLTGIEAFTAASESLKPARIAGCGGLASRHDAMLAAERGADYVMFGEPARDGRRPSFEAIVERIGWWAEVFEVPCVAYAAALDEIAPLAEAGADFIAFGDRVWDDPGGPVAAIAAAAGRLAAREPVA